MPASIFDHRGQNTGNIPAPNTVHRAPCTVYRLLIFLLLAAGCQGGPDKNKLAVDAFVAQQVEERLALYKSILDQQCRENILEEAGKIADSVLISEARLKRDSLNKPARPVKPEKPEVKTLKDSLSLDPLFRDTTNSM